jgi:uncharacterized protein YecT (DUF1311 family)
MNVSDRLPLVRFAGCCAKSNNSYKKSFRLHLLSTQRLNVLPNHSSNRTSPAPDFLSPCAQFLLVAALCAPCLAAQQTAPPPSAPPEPPPGVTFQNPIPAGQLAFLNDYAGKEPQEIFKDKRFRNLLKLATPRTTFHYGVDMSLSQASEDLLKTEPLPITVRDGRYVTIGSHGGSHHAGRTFMWFDMKDGIALGGVYFRPGNGEPTPTLAIFSRQLNQEALSMGDLPEAFAEDLNQWAYVAQVPVVTVRYFIPNNGKKYVLVHDEDYCWHPDNTPPPPEDQCEQMNADAADADVNGAYFMKETHNQANATAWMLGPDQVAWIGLRDRTCIGPNVLGCRIRVSRQRTQVLTGHPMPPRSHPPSRMR